VDNAGNAVIDNAGVWSVNAVDHVISGISCLSTGGTTSFCAAVDRGGNLLTTANEWTTVSSKTSIGGTLNSVSCSNTSFCALVAKSGKATIWQGQGGFQTTQPDTNPLLGVSCFTASTTQRCWAVDKVGNTVSYNGTSWSASTKIDGTKILEGVSCLSGPPNNASYCSVVDSTGDILTFNGTSWSLPINIDGTKVMKSVACTSSSVCVAVDSSGTIFRTTNDWAAGSVTSVKVGTAMDSLSCDNTTTCQSVNGNGKAFWTTNQWTTSSSAKIDSHTLEGISCWGATNCSAVDGAGFALTSDNDWINTSVVAID
jgi:hypothetical protein